MRTYPILALTIGILVEACADGSNLSTSGDPSSDGTLLLSAVTAGGDPDRDGFQLTIDGVGSITLEPTDSAQVIIPAGRHALGLQGVAGQCSVDPAMPLDVDIASQGTTPVAFAVNCPAVGASVTIATTGPDIDQDGYRVAVDGIDQAPTPSNAVAFVRAEAGSRTITLTGLASNCAFTGPASQTVTIVPNQPAPVEFAVVCTSTTGVIAVSLSAPGAAVEGVYQVIVDGVRQSQFLAGPYSEVIFVAGGKHLVELAPFNPCSVATPQQAVNVTVGELVRDTVQVNFTVSCAPSPPGPSVTVRITTSTTGEISSSTRYAIWYDHMGAWDYSLSPNSVNGGGFLLGSADPNGTLVTELEASSESGADPYWYTFELRGVPGNCTVRYPTPDPGADFLTIPGTREIEFAVTCP